MMIMSPGAPQRARTVLSRSRGGNKKIPPAPGATRTPTEIPLCGPALLAREYMAVSTRPPPRLPLPKPHHRPLRTTKALRPFGLRTGGLPRPLRARRGPVLVQQPPRMFTTSTTPQRTSLWLPTPSPLCVLRACEPSLSRPRRAPTLRAACQEVPVRAHRHQRRLLARLAS